MKHTAHKLLALVMALAMLMSVLAVAEDGTQAIVGADGPIELGGETVDETRDPAGDMEIATDEGDGITNGALELEDGADLDMNLDLDADLGLNLDMEDGTLETLEGELAPETEVAMNATGDGASAATAKEIEDWIGLSTALTDSSSTKPTDEGSEKPTYYKLKNTVIWENGSGSVEVGSNRHVVLDLNGFTINGNGCDASVINVMAT